MLTRKKQNGEEGFGQIEAEFLYAFVAAKKPSQIFQIGCGVSTAVCLSAAEDAAYSPEVLCVEPYPTQYLVREAKEGRIELIPKKLNCWICQLLTNLIIMLCSLWTPPIR